MKSVGARRRTDVYEVGGHEEEDRRQCGRSPTARGQTSEGVPGQREVGNVSPRPTKEKTETGVRALLVRSRANLWVSLRS